SIPVFGTDWQRLAKDTGADAVSVCLPPGPNAQISTEALESGLHVICEKPPGRNRAQAQRMADAAASRPGQVHTIAFNRRFSPLYLRAMEMSRNLSDPYAFYGKFTREAM